MRASVLAAFNTNVLLVMTYIATGTLTQAYIAMGQAYVVTGALTFTYIPVGHFHKPTMHSTNYAFFFVIKDLTNAEVANTLLREDCKQVSNCSWRTSLLCVVRVCVYVYGHSYTSLQAYAITIPEALQAHRHTLTSKQYCTTSLQAHGHSILASSTIPQA